MFNSEYQQHLPQLDPVELSLIAAKGLKEQVRIKPREEDIKRHQETRTITYDSLVSIGGGGGGRSQSIDNNIINLPPIVAPNSSLVRQRASAKDCLVAATVTTGASLPLMIGGRSKCVFNLVEEQQQQKQRHQLIPSGEPKNTAFRAEQRRQNMTVSVVRPQLASNHDNRRVEDCCTIKTNNKPPMNDGDSILGLKNSINTSSFSSGSIRAPSIIDEFVDLDNRAKSFKAASTFQHYPNGLNEDSAFQFPYPMFEGDSGVGVNSHMASTATMLDKFGEQHARQQLILFRREEFELNRSVRKQHKFILNKIEERKRYLQIIQSVWAQKDFKHAIEKLVDVYQCGLVFSNSSNSSSSSQPIDCFELSGNGNGNENNINSNSIWAQRQQQQQQPQLQLNKTTTNSRQQSNGSNNNNIRECPRQSQLNSMNTPLVVDVIGMIVLRPKLWNLEICQLVLPIIVNDLLMQKTKYENYIEVAIKALKLILAHFSQVIRTTLNSGAVQLQTTSGQQQQQQQHKTIVTMSSRYQQRASLGVDLSQEDRLNKCLNCYKLLLEAHGLVSKRCSSLASSTSASNSCPSDSSSASSRLLPMFRELYQSLTAFLTSLDFCRKS